MNNSKATWSAEPRSDGTSDRTALRYYGQTCRQTGLRQTESGQTRVLCSG